VADNPDIIAKLIDRFLLGQVEDPHNLRAWVERHRALPVVFDMGGCYAVRVTGEVVSFGWDARDDVALEKNLRIRNGMLYQAAKRFPELRVLVPARPSNGAVCDSCDGSGRPNRIPATIENIVCYCGGLGWLPAGKQEEK
jgi:hypothetical protein